VILGGYLSDVWRPVRPARPSVREHAVGSASGADHRFHPDNEQPHRILHPYLWRTCSPQRGSALRWRRAGLVSPDARHCRRHLHSRHHHGGLALGPYYAGKMSVLAGDLGTGIFALYAMRFHLVGLWLASRKIGEWRQASSIGQGPPASRSDASGSQACSGRRPQPNTPHAILAPLFPEGSVRKSSARS
jgi:hypothetical protein